MNAKNILFKNKVYLFFFHIGITLFSQKYFRLYKVKEILKSFDHFLRDICLRMCLFTCLSLYLCVSTKFCGSWSFKTDIHNRMSRPSGAVVRGAGCYTKGLGFESQVKHGCQTVRPWPNQWLCSKTGRRGVPRSFLGRACRPSRLEFSMVFSETRVNRIP